MEDLQDILLNKESKMQSDIFIYLVSCLSKKREHRNRYLSFHTTRIHRKLIKAVNHGRA